MFLTVLSQGLEAERAPAALVLGDLPFKSPLGLAEDL